MLQKGVYPYEYINDWEKFNEALPEKEDLYSHLNMEDISDLKIKNLGEYHDLYVRSDTLLLADILIIFEICVLKYMN